MNTSTKHASTISFYFVIYAQVLKYRFITV